MSEHTSEAALSAPTEAPDPPARRRVWPALRKAGLGAALLGWAAAIVGCGAEGEPIERRPPPPAARTVCAGTAVRATIELGPSGSVLLGAVLIDDAVRTVAGELEIVDEAGQVVASAAVPALGTKSIIAPPGESAGDGVAVDRQIVTVVAPWPAGARAVRLGTLEVSEPVCAEWLGKADGTRIEPELVRGEATALGRFDVVVLGDGYRESELSRFRSDAVDVADALLDQEPFRTYRGVINVWRLPRASTESGAGTGHGKDTSYGCYYGCQGLDRLICCNGTEVHQVAQGSVPSFDALVLLVNDSRYGGAGDMEYASTYNGEHMPDVVTHELGHQLGLLDEYTYVGFSGYYPAKINCSNSSAVTPWEPWRSEPTVDAFAGCGAAAHFRPTQSSCLMLELGKGLCPVCREHVLEQIVGKARTLAVAATPAPESTVTMGSSSRTFRVTPVTSTVSVSWWLDGASLGASGKALTLSSCDGTELVARLTDETPFARNDPQGALTQELRWTLSCL